MEQTTDNRSTPVLPPPPNAVAAYGHAWRRMWKYPLELLIIFVVLMLFHIPFGGEQSGGFLGGYFQKLGKFAYTVFILWPLYYGIFYVFLRAARGEVLMVKDLFHGFHNFLNAVLASLFLIAVVGFGLVLLLVPGVYFAIKLIFTPYLITDKNMGVIAAMKKSWAMTSGHALQIFFMGLLATPVVFAGFIVLYVGVFISIIWIGVAFAAMYFAVSTLNEAEPV